MKTTPGNTREDGDATKTPNIWLLGMRPRTLTMAAVPVAVGARTSTWSVPG